ncbi:MAG: PD-(D/E)XK nuclease family protein, partial [Anaerolineae bacterium]|nr:PD-(D/E)XK nuclease family protein [Anaerolineae bacterium]
MTETALDSMLAVIEAFDMLNRERRSEGVAAMRRALEAFAALRVQRSAIVGFNTFALLNVGTDEVRHSAFLAWLLDPSAGHGQGDLFLKALLAKCLPPIDLALPEQVHVQTEFAGVESI